MTDLELSVAIDTQRLKRYLMSRGVKVKSHKTGVGFGKDYIDLVGSKGRRELHRIHEMLAKFGVVFDYTEY